MKNNGNISVEPTFVTQETKQQFLQKQIEKLREVKSGEATWADLNTFRQGYGYPDTNVDSLRRSFQQLNVYDEEGWICPTAEGALVSSITDKAVVNINFDKDETTSTKTIELTEAQLYDPEALMIAHGIDPDKWVVKQVNNAKIERYGLTGDTETYSSRITVRPKTTRDFGLTDIKSVVESLKDFKAPKCSLKKEKIKSNEYLLVPLYDLHWGRLSDQENFEEYNIEKEKQNIISHVEKYLIKFKGRKFNKIYLVLGQDFLNSSFTGYTSSQAHLQDNVIDFKTMFRTGSELLISIIDMFSSYCNDLVVVGSLGNHDVAEEIALFQLISAYYRNDSSITVDDGTAPRKYFEIGNACVGLGHADKEKDRLYGLMQCEAPDIWARTKSHIFVTGHLHHFEVNSKQGVEVFRVPSICPRDRWTVEQGYVQNEPKTMCFIFDDDQGLSETHFMYL